jgi:hypothetical protein
MRTIQEYIKQEIDSKNRQVVAKQKTLDYAKDETRILCYSFPDGKRILEVFNKQVDGSFKHDGFEINEVARLTGAQILG